MSVSVGFSILICTQQPHLYLALISGGVPTQWKSPPSIIPSLVERASASSIECVVRITDEFFFYGPSYEIIFHIKRRPYGSIPVEGSSKSNICGFPMMAQAKESLLLLPPDKLPERAFSNCVKRNSDIIYSTTFFFISFGRFFIQQQCESCYRTVSFSRSASN